MPARGIVIYHIDENANGFKQRGYPGHPNWPAEHFLVHVLQPDGLYELEQGLSFGDPGDFWVKDMQLGPNEDGNTWPNTDTYQGGNVKQTGIKITILTEAGFIMLFKVEGLQESAEDSDFAPELLPDDLGDAQLSALGSYDNYDLPVTSVDPQSAPLKKYGSVSVSRHPGFPGADFGQSSKAQSPAGQALACLLPLLCGSFLLAKM